MRKSWDPAHFLVTFIFVFALAQSVLTLPVLPNRISQKDDMEKVALYLKDYVHQSDLVTASTAHLPALRYFFNYHDIPASYIRESGNFRRAFIVVDRQRGETLESVSPKMGFGFPLIEIDSAQVLAQFNDLIIYECAPVS